MVTRLFATALTSDRVPVLPLQIFFNVFMDPFYMATKIKAPGKSGRANGTTILEVMTLPKSALKCELNGSWTDLNAILLRPLWIGAQQ